MSNLQPVDPKDATGKTKELLDFVQQRSGRIPNMIRLLANSPAALGAYLNFAGAFREAALPAKLRDLLAVTVAEAVGCDYTLSAVSSVARNGGRSEAELAAARTADSGDPKVATALRFAAKTVVYHGHLPESELRTLRAAGFSDGEVAEIIATVALNIYRSYFNLIARPEIDFPVLAAHDSPSAQKQAGGILGITTLQDLLVLTAQQVPVSPH